MASAVETASEVRAEAKWVRVSPRKARLVVEHIRGRSVPEARTVLAFTPRAAAREVEKVLKSAVANAEANHGLMGDDLVVSAAYVDEGPTLKRWRPRARGRVGRIKKRTCHITVRLAMPGGREGALSREPHVTAQTETPRRRRRRGAEPAAETVEPTPEATSETIPSAQPEAAREEGESPEREEA
jgi:large subunit ribosomal protein L22